MKRITSTANIKDPYTRRILSNVIAKDAFTVYRRTPRALKQLLRGLGKRDLRKPLAKGKWSITQIVSHLSDTELVMAFRYRMAIAQSGSRLLAYDQDKWARNMNYDSADLRTKLDLFLRVREENIALLGSLGPKGWKRYGMHQERGKETVERMVQMTAGHDLNHLKQIRDIGKGLRTGKT
ncbi:MAG: DinB family protein [Ignavibacteria bacterium]|nr:MAG: DinB family protein [Ignavibacteria bacterium]